MGKQVRAEVTIEGTRTLLQNYFGPEAIPLEKQEREGVAGNNPNEWKKTCMVSKEGILYFPGTYVFGCLKNGAIHTREGRGSLQPKVISTLQVETDTILLNRTMPQNPSQYYTLTPPDADVDTFIYVAGVVNKATKGRNVRYRLATRAGWKGTFVISWDRTVVAVLQMKAILRDAGTLGGIGDGIKIGCGRFAVTNYVELNDAEETPTEGAMGTHQGNGLASRQEMLRALPD